MGRSTKTGFDRYLERRMEEPAFAAVYGQARAEIDATETLIRALERQRARSGMTKAELARRIRAKPEIVRRLLTRADGNPTMGTVLQVVAALGCHLELVSASRSGPAPEVGPTRKAGSRYLATERGTRRKYSAPSLRTRP